MFQVQVHGILVDELTDSDMVKEANPDAVRMAKDNLKYVSYRDLSDSDRHSLFPALDLVHREQWAALCSLAQFMLDGQASLNQGQRHEGYVIRAEGTNDQRILPYLGHSAMDNILMNSILATFIVEGKWGALGRFMDDIQDIHNQLEYHNNLYQDFAWKAFSMTAELYPYSTTNGRFTPEVQQQMDRYLHSVEVNYPLDVLAGCALEAGHLRTLDYINSLREVRNLDTSITNRCYSRLGTYHNIRYSSDQSLSILVDARYAEHLAGGALHYVTISQNQFGP
ncbi:hypothetical protein H4R33_004573 [Dimargaris cristalligena]|nr:hypothetical protein H4R33_004573 [Dimargaris cristalligena]